MLMNLIKCPNNHIYNADRFPDCPECASIILENQHNIPTDEVERPIEEINSAINAMLVGWLVCIDGAEYGNSFPIHEGYNAIGRGANMDIYLKKDPEVSRFIHAAIIYNSKDNAYYLETKNGVNPVIINGKSLSAAETEPVLLNDRDRIIIGAMTFIFIALCKEDFSWKETL